ncbi:MAG: tetratricopeptide repeat protein, partial [Bacteroidales bacterium]|nr:tetratricopeptide repeat protein [Bacteroidales bacterium]
AEEALRTVSELSVRAEGVVWKRLQRVRILNILGRHAEAVTECQAILKDFPAPADAASIRYQLAESYGHLKQYLKAEAELRMVLEHDPDDVLALNNLGYNLADQNRKLAEAESRIRRAIALDRDERLRLGNPEPQNGIYLDSLGWVLFRREKFEEAFTVLEQATQMPDSGNDAVVWDHLGDTAFRLGKKQRAQEAWSKAESLYTNSRFGQEGGRLEELRRKLKLVE